MPVAAPLWNGMSEQIYRPLLWCLGVLLCSSRKPRHCHGELVISCIVILPWLTADSDSGWCGQCAGAGASYKLLVTIKLCWALSCCCRVSYILPSNHLAASGSPVLARPRASKVSVAACLLSPPRKSCRPRVSQQQVPRTAECGARSWRAPAGRAARCRVTDLLQGYTLLGLWAGLPAAALGRPVLWM